MALVTSNTGFLPATAIAGSCFSRSLTSWGSAGPISPSVEIRRTGRPLASTVSREEDSPRHRVKEEKDSHGGENLESVREKGC